MVKALLMKVPLYAVRPVIGLLEHWRIKVPIVVMLGAFYEWTTPVLDVYQDLLMIDVRLLGLAVGMYLLDWVSGMMAAWRDGRGLSSTRFRQAGWKLFEYAFVIGVCLMLANGTAETWASAMFAPFDEAGPIYVAVTEAFSVWENATKEEDSEKNIFVDLQNVVQGNWEELADNGNDL